MKMNLFDWPDLWKCFILKNGTDKNTFFTKQEMSLFFPLFLNVFQAQYMLLDNLQKAACSLTFFSNCFVDPLLYYNGFYLFF